MAVHQVGGDVLQTALYCPYMSPPMPWIKHSLLLFEQVSSIVHPSPAKFGAELEWLMDEGLWAPTTVSSGYVEGYKEEIEAVMLRFADRPGYQFRRNDMPPARETERLYVGKLSAEIENSLLDLGLAKLGRYGGTLIVHHEVAAIILAVTAKFVAATHRAPDSRMIPSTDLPMYQAVANDPLRGFGSRHRCLELMLDGLVPVPDDRTSIEDVVLFRKHNGDDLLKFRVQLQKFLRTVQESEDPLDEIGAVRTEIEHSINELTRCAKSRKVGLIAAGCSILCLGALVSNLMSDEMLHWVFDGFGTTAIVALSSRLVRGSADADSYSYLLKARRQFG
ncbi:hypothetical protein IRY44_25175 [Micromonospora sp. ANENR4]|uniref:DUF6236 family protein n=1 Tax=Micromonospora sp. ANENR4 TaxID=2783662 RepID=UPI00188DEA87|nr:DUF6236 family protein [Micromonospora sp. ANENR4]MBF5033051.1 hypothetical protein [Micromonospora sp. ANENR4]